MPTSNNPHLSIDLNALKHNYTLLSAKNSGPLPTPGTDWPAIMPVIKADAYGHGLMECGCALHDAGARAFAVGTVEEGVALRTFLEQHTAKKTGQSNKVFAQERILSLLGISSPYEVEMAVMHGITLCLHRMEQLNFFSETIKKFIKKVSISGNHVTSCPLTLAVKMDSGMNRLGLSDRDVLEVFRSSLLRPEIDIQLLYSHLSSADNPDENEFSREQVNLFFNEAFNAARLKSELAFSLFNSAGLLNAPDLTGKKHTLPLTHRPGLALYGSNPFNGTTQESLGTGLKPVMQLFAPVLEVRDISSGSSISYNRSFIASEDMRIAVLRCGYADGYSRLLSDKGPVLISGERSHIIGRICMQLMLVRVPKKPDSNEYVELQNGDLACLLGNHTRTVNGKIIPAAQPITIEEIAHLQQTVPYEIYCQLGRNRKIFLP